MPQGQNSYSSGLNQDTSNSKNSNQTYYYLLNGKVVTETGSSTGSITNETGNKLLFKIPDTAPVYEILVPEGYTGTSGFDIVTSGGTFSITLTSTTIEDMYIEILNYPLIQVAISAGLANVFLNSGRLVVVGLDDLISITLTFGLLTVNNVVPALTDLKICGWGNLESKIIIFTTDNRDDTPVDEAGQIWELEFDEENDIISGLVNNFLVPSTHLRYNNQLNLSLANRVGEVIGRYENSKIRGVYFTDFYNNLRSFNLANTEGLALPPSDLDVRADLNLSQPTILSIGSGSIPIGSVVQYGYRLKTVNGSTSIISHLSPPTPLADNPVGVDYEDFKGQGFNTSDSRSVTYRISDIDTSFTLIEHICILYENLDVPQILAFKEELVPLNGELIVTHTGAEDNTILTQQELNALNLAFVCKSITSKRNKLIAANINYQKVQYDFDARAYRFNGSGTCLLYDKQGTPLTTFPTLASLVNLPSTYDAINPYNDESGTVYNTVPTGTPVDWETNFQYKYQSDGATLGGEGTNIKYEFISTNTIGYSAFPNGTLPHVYANRNINNITLPDGETITNINYFGDFKSPLISTYLKGYKRGEVYRFGITFFDKKGNPSLVSWIGDIRFPETSEFEDFGSGTTDALDTKQIGIQFTVDISSIQTEISGFSIVRLERTESDKTRLGTGLPIGLTNTTGDQYTSLEGLFGQTVSQEIDINGTSEFETYYIQDYPGETAFTNFFTALFPFQQNEFEYNFKTGDYLKEVGHYITKPYCTYYDSGGDNTLGVFYQGYEFASLNSYKRFLIEEQNSLPYRGTQDADDFITGDVNTIVNASYSRSGVLISGEGTPLGLGNKKQIILIDTTPPTGFSGDIRTGWNNGIFSGGTSAPVVGTQVGSGDFEIKVLDYCRFPIGQYGGASYEARASQTYISTGHFQFVDNTTASINVSNMYGGDTFTTYYTDEYITMHWETTNSTPFNQEHSNNKLSVAVGFPCETDINFNLRKGNTFSDDQDYSGTWTETLYDYNKVYSQEGNVVQQYISPAIIDTSTEEHPHAIIISEEKIDGEAFDAWKIFNSNDFIEVDGVHGDINKIITYNDKVIFYQTRAIGQVSVQDRSITQDTTGAEVILGTGTVLDYYGYITTNYGCFHQFSVVITPNGVYSWDTLGKKIIRLAEGASPISDVKGLSAFIADELTGNIRELDQTLWSNHESPASGNPAVGIHGVYDKRNSRVIWTVLKGAVESIIDRITGLGVITWVPDNFTITFNEMMNSFESFKSFTPKLYLANDTRLLSTDPENMEQAYLHNCFTRGSFYGTIYPTSITILINTSPNEVKTLDVIEFLMDLTTSAGVDIPLETFNTLRIYNSYQDTGTLTLTPQNNITRRLRKWRMNTLRDNATNKPRLRDYHFFLELTYNNNADKEMVLHDLIHYVRPSNF
jgi:hypothetical protein